MVDTSPDAFSFTAQTGAALSSTATSNTITVSGINSASPISISGGSYKIGSGSYVTSSATVNNGDTVTVQQSASGSGNTLTTATLTIGGSSAAFNVTTGSAAAVNGVCASIAATAFKPVSGLCTTGTASAVSAASPWAWTCAGSGGGNTASCSAPNAATATGSGSARASISGGSWVVDAANSGFVATSTVPSLPPGTTFPHGLLNLKLTGGGLGASATVVITYPSALPAGTVYWKYGRTASNTSAHWYQFAGAAISGSTITLTLTDGADGDDDMTADSVITDPGGPGYVPTAANVAPTFVGVTTTLTVAQGASATDVKGLLHASDADASQTLTWTQNAAPTHGTLAITSATAASGSADVTPGGTITYTPTAGYVGSDSFTVQVSDGTATATRSITVTVGSALTVTVGALTLNSMTVGTAYTSQTFSATGGNAPYTYTVSAGTLPAGLSLNASTGALSGTPTTAGAYSFTIRAVDSSTGTGAPFAGTQAFSGTVAAAAVTATQTNIATLTNGVTAALAATGCSGVNSAVFITAPAGAPSNTTFPFGLLDFRLTGCSGSSVSVTVTYSQNLPANAVFYKELNGTYATYPTTAIGPNSVTFTLTDGGAGDADGLVDGNIHDPSGVGVSAAPASIPTLSEWGLILLTSLMAMFGIKQTRRRKGAQA